MAAGMNIIVMITRAMVALTRQLIAPSIFANLFLLAKSVVSVFAEESCDDLFGAEALQAP
jgi:hypothetical protein